MTSEGFSIEQPISVWNKSLQANFRDLFTALGKTAAEGIKGDWNKAAQNLLDAVKTVGLEEKPGQLGWALIYRGLVRAVFELVRPYWHRLDPNREGEIGQLGDRIQLELEDQTFQLTPSFFEHPREATFLPAVTEAVAFWLETYGLEPRPADEVARRLPAYFVFQLNEEWRENDSTYAPILKALDTPFTLATKREADWRRYNAWLNQQMDEPMFNEPFSLRRLYIPPRACWHEYKGGEKDREQEEMRHDKKDVVKHVVDLEAALRAWIQDENRDDAIRLISGGPGAGKSSFCKHLAASLADDGTRRVLFIPLHRLEVQGDLIDTVGAFVRNADFFDHNPLSPNDGESRILLILDGLDELAMTGEVGLEASRSFVREVQTKIATLNAAKLRLQVVISGRDIVIGENRDGLRKDCHVFYVLPYYQRKNNSFKDPDNLLKKDQRNDWWRAYAEAVGREEKELPEPLKDEQYEEITSQPLLNLLLAMSYTRGKVDFAAGANLNLVYEDLLDAVYERGWEGSATYKPISNLSKAKFIQVLEEIAMAVRHGDGRTASIKEIHDYCDSQGLTRLLEEVSAKAETGITSLLTAFYFRHSMGRGDGSRRFEFTHKSFGEYLVARRLTRGLKRIAKELRKKETEYDEGWSMETALERWLAWTGPAALDDYVAEFLHRQIHLEDKAEVAHWQDRLCKMIEYVLKKNFPLEKHGISFGQMMIQAQNSGEALLVALAVTASRTERVSDIDWPSETAFGDWFHFLHGQRWDSKRKICHRYLSWLNLSNQIIIVANFNESNFENSILINTLLDASDFHGAILRGADLTGAHLYRADLTGAYLNGAHLTGADLTGADLTRTVLSGADLTGAYLTRANLTGAKLAEADLAGAHLYHSIVVDANFTHAYGLTKSQMKHIKSNGGFL